MNAALPAPDWTWGDSLRLVSWSLLWFAVLLPVVAVEALVLSAVVQAPGWTVGEGTWWSTLESAVGWALLMAAFALGPAVAGAAVALPLVRLLGSVLRRVPWPAVHVAAAAALAAALAAVPIAVEPELWAVFAPLPLAASSAAALARAGAFWWPRRPVWAAQPRR